MPNFLVCFTLSGRFQKFTCDEERCTRKRFVTKKCFFGEGEGPAFVGSLQPTSVLESGSVQRCAKSYLPRCKMGGGSSPCAFLQVSGLVPDMATPSSLNESAAVSNMSNGSTLSSIPPPAAAVTSSSCRRKKSEGASFVQDIRDHFDEFVHASMDEHKACFKNTLDKMFKSSKKTANESELQQASVESVLPLNSTTSL